MVEWKRFDCFRLNSSLSKALRRQGIQQSVAREPFESQLKASGILVMRRSASEPEALSTVFGAAITAFRPQAPLLRTRESRIRWNLH